MGADEKEPASRRGRFDRQAGSEGWTNNAVTNLAGFDAKGLSRSSTEKTLRSCDTLFTRNLIASFLTEITREKTLSECEELLGAYA